MIFKLYGVKGQVSVFESKILMKTLSEDVYSQIIPVESENTLCRSVNKVTISIFILILISIIIVDIFFQLFGHHKKNITVSK